jgi:hypothetical protein
MKSGIIAASSRRRIIPNELGWEDIPNILNLYDADDAGSTWNSRVGSSQTLTRSGTMDTLSNWLSTGKNIIKPTTTGNYSNSTTISLGSDSAISVAAVGQFPVSVSVGGLHTLLNGGGAPENYSLLLYRPSASATINLIVAPQAGVPITLINDISPLLNLPFAYAVRHKVSDWACRLWSNGTLYSGSSSSGSGATGFNNGIRIFSTSTGINNWNGYLARFSIFQRGLTNQELEQVVTIGKNLYNF